jgi:glycerol-3-phosphate dehydrogenase
MVRAMQERKDSWDLIIIGGGATGLGAAVDAASRGLSTLLLEQCDFAKATSCKSTKLIHGGLRYLEQGNVHLVKEGLKERGLLCANAPHLIHHLPFLIPAYHWWEKPFYGIGLKIYDLLAKELKLEKCKNLSREAALDAVPTLLSKNLRGGSVYYDGQFDDARLAICLARTAADQGATLINYMRVTGLMKKKGICCGVHAIDKETQQTYQLSAKIVISAAGVFSDAILRYDDPKTIKQIIAPSQGIHLVLDKAVMPGNHALLIPHTKDKRLLFLIPWQNRVLLGTTDTPVSQISLEPRPSETEIDYLLEHASHYLQTAPSKKDVVSLFAGLRPLIKVEEKKKTASLSREHSIFVSDSQLITIAGGKWTTYRKMAEDVIDKAIAVGKLPSSPSKTDRLALHGAGEVDPLSLLSTYGTDAKEIRRLIKENKELGDKMHPTLPYVWAEVAWCIENEMARTVEDVLARRTRCLLLDARLSIELAPRVAKTLTDALKKGKEWQENQVAEFTRLAKQYNVESYAPFINR